MNEAVEWKESNLLQTPTHCADIIPGLVKVSYWKNNDGDYKMMVKCCGETFQTKAFKNKAEEAIREMCLFNASMAIGIVKHKLDEYGGAENMNHETNYTDNPVCPHCGHEYKEAQDWYEFSSDGVDTCDECGKDFKWFVEFEESWITEKLEEPK